MSFTRPSDDAVDAHDVRDPVEEIAEQFLEEVRAGECVTIEQYQQAHPKYAAQIEALFPALLLMEDVKPAQADNLRTSDSADTLLERNLQRLGDYRIIRRIGYGGMGIVYLAEQESLGRLVAMKIFAPTLFSSQRQIRRFKREAQAAARLHHSNIVPVIGVGEQWGIHYYIMQYVDGRSIDRVLRAPNNDNISGETFDLRGNWSRIADIGCQIAGALQYAHSQKVLHRDIKPANLLLDQNGTACITDFGLAKLISQDGGATRTGQVVGTLRYMAPEQLQGKADARSDIYSLGLTLYELITWRQAFDESNHSLLVRQKLTQVPARPRSLEPSIPRDLETIVMKAIAREPRHRYQTAAALNDDLGRFLKDLPIQARRVSTAERLARWSRRNPALATACALVFGLAVSIAAVTAWSYFRVQRVLATATEERARAVAASELATGALDSIFDRFGIESIETDPGLEPTLSSEAAVLLEQLIRYYDQLADDDSQNPVLLYKAAEAQLKIGNIRARLGQYDQAREAYQHATEKFAELATSPETQLKLARLKNHQGQVSRWLGETSDPLHLAAMDVLQTLEDSLSNSVDLGQRPIAGDRILDLQSLQAQIRYERARGCLLLATGIRPGMSPESMPPESAFDSEPLGKPAPNPETQRWLKEAQAELQQLVEQVPDQPAFRQLLARCLRERAADHLSHREADDEVAERQAIEILEALVSEYPHRLEYQFDLMETLAEISIFRDSLRPLDDETIRARLERAITLGEALVSKRPDVTLYASGVIHAHFKLSNILLRASATGSPDERAQRIAAADQHGRAAISRQAELIRRFPTASGFAAWQALFRQHMAALLLRQGDLDGAQYQVTAAIFLIEELMQVSAAPVLDQMADQAYQTLDRVFALEGTPPELRSFR